MPGQDAGALPLTAPELRRVDLPFPGKYILQDPRFQPVTDASAQLVSYILSAFPDTPVNALELGCGCGIVSIMLALSRPAWSLTGIDIQPEQALLSSSNALLCGVSSRFIHADLITFTPDKDFPLIFGNPPWMPVGHGIPSPTLQRRVGREELSCTMQDVLCALARLLPLSGEGVLIYPAFRKAQCEELISKTSLDIIDLVWTNDSKKYFICHTRQRGNNDC